MPIDVLALGAALLAGVLGSSHCALMCGGIATGFSAMAGSGPQRSAGWRLALESNLGRVGGYVLAGTLVGAFGQGLLDLARVQWLANAARLLTGAVLVLVALRLLDSRSRLAFLSRPATAFWQHLRPLQRRLLPANTPLRRIGLGMVWGWMPCGLSTMMLTAALLQGDTLGGALVMGAFGLGTLPVMLPLTWSGARVGRSLQRAHLRTALGGIVLVAGVVAMSAPWLMHVPALHGPLAALGCVAAG